MPGTRITGEWLNCANFNCTLFLSFSPGSRCPSLLPCHFYQLPRQYFSSLASFAVRSPPSRPLISHLPAASDIFTFSKLLRTFGILPSFGGLDLFSILSLFFCFPIGCVWRDVRRFETMELRISHAQLQTQTINFLFGIFFIFHLHNFAHFKFFIRFKCRT